VACCSGKDEGKYGYIDSAFNQIIPFKYDLALDFSGNMASVKVLSKDGQFKWYMINRNDEILYELDYRYVCPFYNNRAIVIKTENNITRQGAINRKGELVVPLNFQNIWSFSNDIAVVEAQTKEKNDLYNRTFGYIDTSGNIIREIVYDKIFNFSNEYGLIKSKNKYFFVNKKGNLAFKDSFDLAFPFDEGYTIIRKGKTWSYLDTLGQRYGSFDSISRNEVYLNHKMTLFTKHKNCLTDFYDYVLLSGNNVLVRDKWKWACFSNGKIISEWYNSYFSFQNNIAVVEKNKKEALLNSYGKICSKWFDNIEIFLNDTISIAKDSNLYYFISNSGNLLFNRSFESANNFSCNRALVKINGKTIFIDRKGKIVRTRKFSLEGCFIEDLACVSNKKRLFGFIDTTGRLSIKCKYEEYSDFNNGFCKVKLNDRYGFINKSGTLVIKPQYSYAENFSDSWTGRTLYAKVKDDTDGKDYLINTKDEKKFIAEYYSENVGQDHFWGYELKRIEKDD